MILKNVEQQILRVEGFAVDFLQAGRDVNGTKEGIPAYPYAIAAQDTWTVSEWIAKRFKQSYSGYDVRVHTKTGGVAAGNMKLATVRGK